MPAKMNPAARASKPAAKPAAKRAAKPAAANPHGPQLVRYDYTIPKVVSTTNFEYTAEIIRTHLEQYCSKWVFQEEKGDPTDLNPDGYEHFQGRVTLVKKRRVADAINRWNAALPSPGVHLLCHGAGSVDGSRSTPGAR